MTKAALLTAAMCFSLVACGSEKDADTPASTTAVTGTAEAATTVEAASTTGKGSTENAEYEYEIGPAIQEIQSRGKLIVGIDSGYVPFCYTAPATGESYGVNVLVAQKVAEVLGVDCEVVSETFSAVLSDLSVDKIDLVGAMVVNTEERAQTMDKDANWENSTISGSDKIGCRSIQCLIETSIGGGRVREAEYTGNCKGTEK